MARCRELLKEEAEGVDERQLHKDQHSAPFNAFVVVVVFCSHGCIAARDRPSSVDVDDVMTCCCFPRNLMIQHFAQFKCIMYFWTFFIKVVAVIVFLYYVDVDHVLRETVIEEDLWCQMLQAQA